MSTKPSNQPDGSPCTVLVIRMAHRIWKETKQQPGTAGPGNMLGFCFISFHFLWVILSTSTVVQAYPDNLGLLDGSRVRVWLTPQSTIVLSQHAKGSETERVRWRMEISGEEKEERIGMECHLVSVSSSTFECRKF